jgi:sugar phosphate isomerase/epimerase
MKLIVPSWLKPGAWLDNLREAEALGWARGVELLCFSFSGDDRELFLRELPDIEKAAGRLSMSVHLPDPLDASSEELVRLTRPFAELYVLHPPMANREAWVGLVERWRERYGDDFLLEYTEGERFAEAEKLLPGLPLCADIGRLLVEGFSPAGWIAPRLGRIREMHLHGAEAGKDHRPFASDAPWLEELKPVLASFEGRVELELFSLEKVEAAYEALRRCMA